MEIRQEHAAVTGTVEPDRRRTLAHWVHWGLLGGLLASSALMVLGLAIVFARHQPRPIGSPPAFRHVLTGMLRGDGLSLLELGLVLLMLTPAARVLILAVGWSRERNVRSAGIAFTVLALLILSIVLGVG